MTTIIQLKPWKIGSPSMKSINTSSHTFSRMGKGCKSPVGAIEDILLA